MTDTDTAHTAGSTITVKWDDQARTWTHAGRTERRTSGAIKVEIGAINEIILTPLTDLGASVLAQLLHGDHEFSAMLEGSPPESNRYGAHLRELRITQKTRPMLSSGDDPYYTGMGLTPDDYKACRALVDKLRAKNRPVRRTRKRPKSVRGPQ